MNWLKKAIINWLQPTVNTGYTSLNLSNGASTYAGVIVSSESAMTEASVWSCVRLISNVPASLPLVVYEKTTQGRSKAESEWTYNKFLNQPNPYQTAFDWKQSSLLHLLLYGNAYTWIERNTLGKVMNLWQLRPQSMTVVYGADGTLFYRYHTPSGYKEFTSADILHFKMLSMDGIVGMSPIEYNRHLIGQRLASQQFMGKMFANGARLSGTLSHPGTLTPEAAARMKENWTNAYEGSDNAFKTALLEEGMKFEPIAIKPIDMEFLSQRKYSSVEIAAIFGVPPHMIGANEKPTYASVEQQSLEFLNYTIRPYLVMMEQTINAALFQNTNKYAAFNVNAFMRTDIKSRYEAYAIARNWGWLSVNDILEMEDRNTIPEGNVYLQPLNMVDSSNPEPPEPKPVTEPNQPEEDNK